jgi:hypothetical protein
MDITEHLEALQHADDARAPEFLEYAYAVGGKLREETDENFIALGAIGDIVTTPRPGHPRTTVVEFALRIGIGRSSASQFIHIVRFFGGYEPCRAILRDMQNISFDHLRAAKRLQDPRKAMEALLAWNEADTSTGMAHVAVSKLNGTHVTPASLFDGDAVVDGYEERPGGVRVTFDLAVGEFDPSALKALLRQHVTLRVTEAIRDALAVATERAGAAAVTATVTAEGA